MKVDFGMIVFNGEYVLQENLETIYPYANKILIAEGPVQHYVRLGYTQSTDNTIDIIKNFPDPDGKFVLLHGPWKEKDDMCKEYGRYMKGDYIFHVDSDELYKNEDLDKIFDYLENHPECYSMSFTLRSFYGGFDRYISGFEENFEVHRIKRIIPGVSNWATHRPPTMIWPPTGKKCVEMGHLSHRETEKMGIYIYHYSHTFPEQVKAKMNYYYQRDPCGIIGDYWNKLFVPWMNAETEAEKLLIEKPTLGVQEWLPHRRGPAYTKAFNGSHPEAIEKNKDKLIQRIDNECKKLGIK
jgi:hypothetical protein